MAELGVADTDTLVAYDDAGGVIAARLVWLLRVTGHEAALLDGGLTAYEGPLEREVRPRPPASFTPRAWPGDRLADIEDAVDPGQVVLDARDAVRFRGEHEPVDPRAGHIPGARVVPDAGAGAPSGGDPDPVAPRAGHIPGARTLPCRANLDPSGRFLPADELRRRFRAAGVDDGSSVVSYCGSGVTACHNLLS